MTTRADCADLDADDPVAEYRGRFALLMDTFPVHESGGELGDHLRGGGGTDVS